MKIKIPDLGNVPIILRVLLCVWAAIPAVLAWVFYILPLWGLGCIEYYGKIRWDVCMFAVVERDDWYYRQWDRWRGFSLPFAMLLKIPINSDTVEEELEHCDQQLVFGPLYWPSYLWFLSLFGYQYNPFEVGAKEETKEWACVHSREQMCEECKRRFKR